MRANAAAINVHAGVLRSFTVPSPRTPQCPLCVVLALSRDIPRCAIVASRFRAPSFTSSATDQRFTHYHVNTLPRYGGRIDAWVHALNPQRQQPRVNLRGLPYRGYQVPGAVAPRILPLVTLVQHLVSLSSQTFKALSARRSKSESCDSNSDGVGMSG